ncbi:hypothetical protein [Paraburkholderia dinghuensis]|uniref:Uncharacterized protein n=1 Tax=Paraburkholderia dinghuensis TaxID=2305225 RepID=A0A3N6MB77_9BURK|nr:hypothetical protein [Paraburkholderia dinghuensis]RQG99817.1 hypothetical protein D1Y85_26180 [Paraburkholderia dinghuensis]
MKFDVYGSYPIPCIDDENGKRKIDRDGLKTLKKTIGSSADGLADCRGCYVFALKHGNKYTPWYIGQAAGGRTLNLLKESLHPKHKLEIYDEVVSENKGHPHLFLLPKLTKNGKFAGTVKKGSDKSLDFLEDWLIAVSFQKNRNLRNDKKTWFLKNLYVAGLFNAGPDEPAPASIQLRSTIF